MLSGLIGSLISAKILDRKNPQYKKLFNILGLIGAIFHALFLVTFLFMIPTFSIIFPYVAELTYPSHEAVSTALMLFSCRLFATCFGVIGTLLA